MAWWCISGDIRHHSSSGLPRLEKNVRILSAQKFCLTKKLGYCTVAHLVLQLSSQFCEVGSQKLGLFSQVGTQIDVVTTTWTPLCVPTLLSELPSSFSQQSWPTLSPNFVQVGEQVGVKFGIKVGPKLASCETPYWEIKRDIVLRKSKAHCTLCCHR